MLTSENTWKEVEESGVTVAIVPIGSTEQHGTNLPLASDSLITLEVAKGLAREIGAYLTPFIPIGTSPEHMSFRGTITFADDTLKAVVKDIVESLARTGFTSIILVSTHGGNYVLWSDFVKHLDSEYTNAAILLADLSHSWEEACKAAGFSSVGMHAGECEASLIASIRPDLIGGDPVDFPDPKKHLKQARLDHAGFPLNVREVSPSGALGEPSKGSKEEGDAFWRIFLKLAVEDVKKQAAL